ncbi:ABC transporter family protein [Winogradskyella eximia]|jgi:ABC-type sulfate/molybdate transport systems ATPase subunit|uniref:ABC transporter family protein n=1 Tax=Winogradskyella eximia TaxID=262006 RepID=A0A3D9HAS3_9FLAO|nr:ABC transporter ATP-binding protein [Winogradskyella eximia]RED46281.1 ABC transporter family protein [Winogradskyella eximia]
MLKVENVSFGYSKTKILKAIDFSVEAGENLAIIGESGSGKSTLLKLIYGEYDLKQGHIFWKDEEILGPKHNLVVGYDFMKYVTQEFDLMPFITVEENIGKYLSRFYPEEKQKRTEELIKVVELEAFAKTKVKLLSGGQKQRVAIARALAKQPEILLLDEPFSHIDNFKKQSLRRSVFKYLKENNIACVVATHDKNDVLGFADQLLVIHQSEIIAKDTPQHIYNHPKLPLIASFFSEFNVIEPYGIVYANQVKIVNQSDLKAVVKTSYFNGNSWLIEAEYNSESIFIEHSSNVNIGKIIFIKVSK